MPMSPEQQRREFEKEIDLTFPDLAQSAAATAPGLPESKLDQFESQVDDVLEGPAPPELPPKQGPPAPFEPIYQSDPTPDTGVRASGAGGGIPVPRFARQGFAESSLGLGANLATGQGLPQRPKDFSTLEGIGAEIVSFVVDPLTYLSFGLGGVVGKKVAAKAATKALGKVAGTFTTGAVGLGTFGAAKRGLQDTVATGAPDPIAMLREGRDSALLGGVAGAAGLIPKLGLLAEIGVFGTGGAALDPAGPRLPNLDDFAHATGVILGIKGAGMIGRALGKLAREGPEALTPEDVRTIIDVSAENRARIAQEAQVERIVREVEVKTQTGPKLAPLKNLLDDPAAIQTFWTRYPHQARQIATADTPSRSMVRGTEAESLTSAAQRRQLAKLLRETAPTFRQSQEAIARTISERGGDKGLNVVVGPDGELRFFDGTEVPPRLVEAIKAEGVGGASPEIPVGARSRREIRRRAAQLGIKTKGKSIQALAEEIAKREGAAPPTTFGEPKLSEKTLEESIGKEKKRAQEIREDQGRTQEEGRARKEGQEDRGRDVQQGAETGREAGEPELSQETLEEAIGGGQRVSDTEFQRTTEVLRGASHPKQLEPLLRALFPDYTEPKTPDYANDFAAGIHRMANKGDEFARIPFVDLSKRIADAKRHGVFKKALAESARRISAPGESIGGSTPIPLERGRRQLAARRQADQRREREHVARVKQLADSFQEEYKKHNYGTFYRVEHVPSGQMSAIIPHGKRGHLDSGANDYIVEESYRRAHRYLEDPQGYSLAAAQEGLPPFPDVSRAPEGQLGGRTRVHIPEPRIEALMGGAEATVSRVETKPLPSLTKADLVKLPQEGKPLPRKAFRGELVDAKGNIIGNIYRVGPNRFKVYDVKEFGRGERVAELPGEFTKEQLRHVKTEDVGYGSVKKYEFKPESTTTATPTLPQMDRWKQTFEQFAAQDAQQIPNVDPELSYQSWRATIGVEYIRGKPIPPTIVEQVRKYKTLAEYKQATEKPPDAEAPYRETKEFDDMFAELLDTSPEFQKLVNETTEAETASGKGPNIEKQDAAVLAAISKKRYDSVEDVRGWLGALGALNTARTGKPFSGRLYKGEYVAPRTKKARSEVLGKGDYFFTHPYQSLRVGRAGLVTGLVDVELDSPYVIRGKAELDQYLATGKDPSARQKKLRKKGHDGIIVTGIKGHSFHGPRLVIFPPPEVRGITPKALKEAEQELLSIYQRSIDRIDGNEPGTPGYAPEERQGGDYRGEYDPIGADPALNPYQTKYYFPDTRKGRAEAAEVREHLPRHLKNRVTILKSDMPNWTPHASEAMTSIGPRSMAKHIIESVGRQSKEGILDRTLDAILAEPELFDSKDIVAALRYRQLALGGETERVTTADITPGDKVEINGDEYRLRRVSPDGTMEFGGELPLFVTPSDVLLVDKGSIKRGELSAAEKRQDEEQARAEEERKAALARAEEERKAVENMSPEEAAEIERREAEAIREERQGGAVDEGDLDFPFGAAESAPRKPKESVGLQGQDLFSPQTEGQREMQFGRNLEGEDITPGGFITKEGKFRPDVDKEAEERIRREIEDGQGLLPGSEDAPSGDAFALPKDSKILEELPVSDGPVSGAVQRRTVLRGIPMPELYELAKELLGHSPKVRRLRKKGAKSMFKRVEGDLEYAQIIIDPSAAKSPVLLAQVLGHEIGHLSDYLMAMTLKRGNIVGRIASLRRHMKRMFGTLDNKALKDELVALSEWWSPYNKAKAPKKYIKYRESARELYAQALSVFLNAPGELSRRAPEFYHGFLEYLGRKPKVLEEYLRLQDILSGTPDQIGARRRDNLHKMFDRAEEKVLAYTTSRKAADASVSEMAQQFLTQYLLDSGAPLVDRARRVVSETRDPDIRDRAENAMFALDEFSHRENDNHVMFSRIKREVQDKLDANELTIYDVGDYLFARRIVNERNEIANPLAHTPETAQQLLAALRTDIGPERFAKLERVMQEWHDILFERIAAAVEADVYSRAVFTNTIEPNKGNYATFAVIKYLEDKVSAAVHKQVGTFEEVANPWEATHMKMLALNRLVNRNLAARAVRDFLLEFEPGDIEQAPIPFGKRSPVKPPPPGKGYLELLEDGKPAAYIVPEALAKTMLSHDIGGLMRYAMLMQTGVYKVFHPLYVTFSPDFQAANIARDFRRTYINMGTVGTELYKEHVRSLIDSGMTPKEARKAAKPKKITLGQVIAAYWRALPVAVRHQVGINEPLIQRMFSEKALAIPYTDVAAEIGETSATSKIMARYGLGPKDEASFVKRQLKRGGEILSGIGAVEEMMSKVAGYDLLLRREVPTKKRAYIVRKYAGTPDYKQGGLITPLTNGAFMYSRVAFNGLQADSRLARSRDTRFGWWRRQVMVGLPGLLLEKGLKAGMLGLPAAIAANRVAQYYWDNYNTVPVGTVNDDGEEKTVFLTIPVSESERLIGAVVRRLLDGLDWQGVFKKVWGEVVPNASPPIDITWKWLQYAQGINPYDSFFGNQIINRTAWEAGGFERAKPLIAWTLNKFGIVSTLAHYPVARMIGNAYEEGEETTVEATAKSLPGIRRILRVTNHGETEAVWAELENEDREKARFKLRLPGAARRATRDRYLLNRLGMGRLDNKDLVERILLNDWYRGSYLTLTDAIRDAEENGKNADSLRRELEVSADVDADSRHSIAVLAHVLATKPQKGEKLPERLRKYEIQSRAIRKWFRDNGITEAEAMDAYRDYTKRRFTNPKTRWKYRARFRREFRR